MKAKIKFLGAAKNVTGSRYLLDAGGTRVLVDCGIYQERSNLNRNWDPFPVQPHTIDAVVLTHAHLDHVGFLPKLAVDGFKGPVYCTPATAEIARIVLLDSGRLQEEDAENKRKRHDREKRRGKFPEKPLYTEKDAARCAELFEPVRYGRPFPLGKAMEATFHDAGHILGSSMVNVAISGDDGSRRLLFSGDVGRWGKPILNDPTCFEDADYVLVESTYGDRDHAEEGKVADRMADEINATVRAGGNLLIPSFAVERAHEILYYLNELLRANRIPHLMVFIDSPMAVAVTEVFQRHPELWDAEMKGVVAGGHSPFEFPGLKMSMSIDDSKAINHVRGTAVIVAGSGMCTGGRIKHHLMRNIGRPECTIMFTGYQAAGTLGREIVSGAPEVRLFGQMLPVKARVARVEGFSGHADRNELLRWISCLKKGLRRAFVVHGEANAAASFAELLRASLSADVVVPDYGDEATLD